MQTQWYGDKRDLVKWATLVHLCIEHKLSKIIQVPFLNDKKPGYWIRITGQRHEVPRVVWDHFRDLNNIKLLGDKAGLDILIIPDRFRHDDRDSYMAELCRKLDELSRVPKVLFLDPDTGIEPKRPGGQHVKISEIKLVWGRLKQGDWLVLYQHAMRRKNWHKEPERRFKQACGGAEVTTSKSDVTRDVVFFCAEKTS